MTVGGIGSLFGRALDGLRVASNGMSVVSNNIANANTKGYARQVFVQGTRASAGNGLVSGGVIALGITNFIDPFVERQLVEENSDLGTFDGRRLVLSNLENIVHESDGEGVGTAINNFFNSWSELSQDAGNGALRISVREAGRELAEAFNETHSQVQSLRTNLSATITTRLGEVNALTSQIAQLNDTIRSATDETAKLELKAQRTVVIQQLSEEVGINYFEAADEAVTVQLVGTGLALVNSGDSAVLSANDDASVGGTYSINSTIPGGSSSIDVTSYITSGRLGGNLIDRNTTLNNSLSDLNQLAADITSQVNAVHLDGYGLDGNDGRTFFAPIAGTDGAAGLMSLDAQIELNTDFIAAASEDPTTSGVGDARNALLFVDLANQLSMGGGTQTYSQYYSNIVSTVGLEAGNVNSGYLSQATLLNKLQIQRENVSGVNLDEEASDLIKYQRAFEGSARVMAVANEMLDTLLGL